MKHSASGRSNSDGVRALVDTHCHLDDPAFDVDRATVLEDGAAAGVIGWVNVGFCRERWTSTIQLSQQTTGMQHALGIHPQHAGEWTPQIRRDLRSLLQSSQAIAVGEIGLDYSRGSQERDVQRRVFADQLDLSLELGMSVIIHQRAAEDDLVSMLQELPHQHPVLLHSFDGGELLTGLALERSYVIGVGGLATRPRNGHLRTRLSSFSPDQIVLESDAPYLVPHGVPERRNTPTSVASVARLLADLQGVSFKDAAATTTANASRFFGSDLFHSSGDTP